MEFRLLGPLEVVDDAGAPVDIRGRQSRILISMLLVAEGRPVAIETIVDTIWGDDPPPSATGTLQTYVSRMRRALQGGPELSLDAGGYRLDVDADAVDFRRFEALADRGRAELGRHEVAEALDSLDAALELWRGPALADLADTEVGRGVAVRLDERRLAAIEDRAAALLELRQHARVAAELPELVAAHPLREELPRLLALAQYRSGRQSDALRTLATASSVLREELGIEPGRPLRELEAAILAHDADLDLPDLPAAAVPTAPTAADGAAVQTGPAGGFSPSGLPLVGRVAEVMALTDALEQTAARSQFVVLEGEPGIGKTRLADEIGFIAARRGVPVVWGRADEGGAAPALWPWLEPLRAAIELSGESPEVVQQLLAGDAESVPGRPADVRFELFDAVASLLAAASATTPLVVLLDDLQWADETSLELLGFLASNLDGHVLVVATMRPLQIGRHTQLPRALAAIARRSGSRRIALRGLTRPETAEIVRSLGGDVDDDAASTIHDRAEGNPFFAIELRRLFEADHQTNLTVPATVGEVISQRLAQLPEDTRELLAVAAVTGRDVVIDLVAAADGTSAEVCLERLEPAINQHVLVDVPDRPFQWRFSHALVREVVLEQLSPLRRARLHLRVADAMEDRGAGADDAEILAEHLWQAAPIGVGGRAASALERASEVAVGRMAYPTAEDLLTRAADLRRATGSTEDDWRAELGTLLRLLDVIRSSSYYQGVRPEIVDRARKLAVDLGEDDVLATLMWFSFASKATAARIAESEAPMRELLELTSRGGRPENRCIALQTTAVWHWQMGRIEDAVTFIDEALELVPRQVPSDDPFLGELVVLTYSFWILLHGLRGDREEHTADDLALAIAHAPNGPSIASLTCFAGTPASSTARWDVVAELQRIAREADPTTHHAFFDAELTMYAGILAVVSGEVEEGLAIFDRGRDRYLAVGGRSTLSTFLANLAAELAQHGEMEDAQQRLDAAQFELDTFRERWVEPIVEIARGRVAAARGDLSVAGEHLALAEEIADEQGSLALVRHARALATELGCPPSAPD